MRRWLWILGVLAGCASTTPSTHGKLSELSRVEGDIVLCEHKVPAQVCTKHHPELVGQFKRAGDWCKEHGVPESQCLECHPDLTFEPLPKLPEGADIASVPPDANGDLPSLDPHAVKGKITVFELYADWCAVCRKVDGHMYKRLSKGDALAYRKVNIGTWESALGQRYLKDVPTLPLIIIYRANGTKHRAMFGADLPLLDKTISEAQASQ